MEDRVGQQLGNYRLIRLLGKGGFAEVYLGEHLHLNTYAAVKVLQAQLTNKEVQQFRNEARTLARLTHPHIVRVLDFGVEGDTPFLVMDYASNGTLRQRHPHGAILPLKTIVTYVIQIADALKYAHDNKVIHRDIKPENMLLGSQNEVLLSDFGIATVMQSSQAQPTQSFVGTVAYMAPEQIVGNPRPASDQYAMGVIVYEWLSGDRPFHGTPVEITTQHIQKPPPPLRQKVMGISPAVEQVVLAALEKDPHQRYASTKDFASALEQCLLSPTSPAKLPITLVPPNLPVSPKTQQPPWITRMPTVLASSVPAFPKPSASLIAWPTFSLSISERQDISSGKLPQESLVATGQVLMAPVGVGPLPVVMTPPPPLTLSGPPLANIVQQGAGQPTAIIKIPQSPQQGMGGIIRTTGGSPLVQPGTGQPVAKLSSSGQGGMTIVRSSVGHSTAPKKMQLPPTPSELAQANRLGVISLIVACLSIISFAAAFVLATFPQIITWDPWIIFTTAILAFFTGAAAMQKKGIFSRTRRLAGFGITTSVFTALLELGRFLFHY